MADQWNAFVEGPRLLVPPTRTGALSSLSFGVKDIIDVAGLPTARGFTGRARIAERSNPAVSALLDAGAACVGKTASDQLAFSLSGTDTATPLPNNPRDRSRLVGGSSSGSAAAVAGGLVPFALSTDTAGSVRVPASYCRIVGFRPTWSSLSMEGVAPLAPRFDTIGWHARDVCVAEAVGAVLLPDAPPSAPLTFRSVLLVDEVTEVVDDRTARAVSDAASALSHKLGLPLQRTRLGVPLSDVGRAFRVLQFAEIAATPRDAADIAAALPLVRERFALANAAPGDDALTARIDAALLPLRQALQGGAILVLPAAAGPAPAREDTDSPGYAHHRDVSVALNAFAGLFGAPSLVTPVGDALLGVAHVAAPGADRLLLATLSQNSPATTPQHDELLTAFYRYEAALVSDDRATLDALFAGTPPCVRFAPEGAAYDRDAIAALRAARPRSAAPRELLGITVESLTNDTAITAVRFRRSATGVRGYQTQTWQRGQDGWHIRMAHVSVDSAGS